MLSLFLIGISPISGPIQSGPPAPHLNRNEHVQQAFHQNLRWKAFQKDWGEEWGIRWDERNGSPRFLYAPGTSIRDESKLVLAISKLVDVPFDDWSFDGSNTRNERRTSVWRRQHQGVSVIGDSITIVSRAGQIHGIWIQVTPLVDIPTPKSNEMVLPIPLHKGPSTVSTGVQSHLVTEHQDNDQIFYLDRLGREVYRYSTRHYGTIEMSLEERTVDDPLIVVPARGVTVENQEGSTVLETDDDGSHAMTDDPLRIRMAGSTVIMTVDRQALALDGRPDTLIEGGIDVPMSATSVHHHFNVVWDWLREQRPDHPWLDDQVLATVELSDGTCNAYYTNGTINFLLEDPESCHNLGQIADVTYHEVGHGIHHYILESGTFAGDVSEGSADFISATILDDPVLAPNARPDGSYIRELETDKRYPDDAIGQVHNDGLIWGSFFWNLREQWEEDTPETGVNRTNQLFLNALAYGPTLTDAYEAVILADDDDGDWSNSTPHACELTDLLDHHGLGPGPMGVMIFEHSPVESVGSFDTDYPVNFSLYPLTEACIDSAEVVAKLWYTTDPSADLEQLEAAINDHSEASKQSNQEDHQNDTGVVFDTGRSGDTGWSDDTGWTDSDTDAETDWCDLIFRKRPLNSRSRVGGRELARSATLSRICRACLVTPPEK